MPIPIIADYDFVWTAFAAGVTDQAPDTDTEIYIGAEDRNRTEIMLQAESEVLLSDDVDINVETSNNGVAWDTVPYASLNLSAPTYRKTILINPGPKLMRLRADNNHASNTTSPTATVRVTKF